MNWLTGILMLVFASMMDCSAQAIPELPRVVLIGDSIRLGYAPLVAKKLEGKAVVISAEPNGGDSGNLLAHLDEWIVREKPDVVHFNAGLHDLKRLKSTAKHQVEVEQYLNNLQRIIAGVRKSTTASMIFGSTTPIDDLRHAARKEDFDRTEADVKTYNHAAIGLMVRERIHCPRITPPSFRL